MRLKVLFLTVRMLPGFGVSVVIEEVAKRLLQRNVDVIVGCCELQGQFGKLDVRKIAADVQAVQTLCEDLGISHVVAHSSPYFEILPSLDKYRTWAWEHGDPDPEFFEHSQAERSAQIQRKKSAVYPNVDGVIAISEFIREQIEWPASKIVRNGWEHVEAQRPVENSEISLSATPEQLRVGCLMRLGTGEESYKGGGLYRKLARQCPNIHFSLMGRGQRSDEQVYANAGIQVFRNASDEQRAGYLQELDVFISPSLWEGCNLPLLEAQAQGTASLAFDSGAHPEFAGLLTGSVQEMRLLLSTWHAHRALLAQQSQRVGRWVRQTFSWDQTVDDFLAAVIQNP